MDKPQSKEDFKRMFPKHVMTEEELREKYPKALILPGSLRDGELKGKTNQRIQTVNIRCGQPDCREVRRIATSDLFQVHFCEDHQKEWAREESRRRRAEFRKRRREYKAKVREGRIEVDDL